MFPETLFAFALEQLAGELSPAPAPDPLNTDTWIARSVMQKAIRRGMTDLALRAAATLLNQDRRTLWRRLLTTALEDLGVGEIDLVARITAASRDSSWRRAVGGEWRVVAHLVAAACAGTRCQSANDLWNIARNDPALDQFKSSLCEAELPDLLSLISDDTTPTSHRAVAVLIATGVDAGPAAPTHIRSDVGAVLSAMAHGGWHSRVVATYAEAYRQTRLALAPLSVCLWSESQLQVIANKGDDLPPVTWLSEVPSFALDQYVRRGKEAIRRFAYTSHAWREFAGTWGIPLSEWPKAAGELLFRAEGAFVTNRRQWQLGLSLYERSLTLGCFVPEEAVHDGLALIGRELAHIDALRARVITTS